MKKPKGGYNTILEIKNNNNMDLEEQYQNEKKQSNQLFDKCNLEAEQISNIDEKIEYWNNAKTSYLKNLPKRVFDVSAITSFQNGIEIEMFFDKLVTDKINQLIQLKRSAIIPPQQTETKTDKLKIELGKYGFFELSKVKQLSEPNKQRLTELISTNDLPYSIAMIEYLGFIKHLKAEYFTTDYKLFKAVANWFEVAERAVKGNIYVLNEISKENRTRYTADQKKQTVQKNYEALK